MQSVCGASMCECVRVSVSYGCVGACAMSVLHTSSVFACEHCRCACVCVYLCVCARLYWFKVTK